MSNKDSASQDILNSTFYVSTIDISSTRDSSRQIESIKLKKNDKLLRDVERSMRAGTVHKEEFCPPLALNPNDHIFVSVKCNSRLSRQVDIDINLRDIDCRCNEQVYRKQVKNIEVILSGYLVMLAGATSQSCSQTRLLVIGNSGVGKSSLIHKVFGVECVHTSETERGDADINREFISPTNERFVVHDSLGFEAGDERYVDMVKQFVARRNAMPLLKDQLHAIWLCLEIPYAGGRLFETGVECFLKRREEIMGKIPLVVVLTKEDLFNTQLELDLPPNENVERYRSWYLNEHLIKPLHEAAGRDVTHVTVSVDYDYCESLSNLVKVTDENLRKYLVDEAPRVVASNLGYPHGSYRVQFDSLPGGPLVGMSSGFLQFQVVRLE